MNEKVILYARQNTLGERVLIKMSHARSEGRFVRLFEQVEEKPSGTSTLYRGTIAPSEGEAVPVEMHLLEEGAPAALPEEACSIELRDEEYLLSGRGGKRFRYQGSSRRGTLTLCLQHLKEGRSIENVEEELTAACTRFGRKGMSPFGILPTRPRQR